MKSRFVIDSNEYKGQLNLDLTIKSGQTSQPAWINIDGYFSEMVTVEGEYCLIKARQEFKDLDAPLEIIAESKVEVEEEVIRTTVKDTVSYTHLTLPTKR